MKEMHKVAILCCVWRQGQGNVVVGVLTPNVSDNDHVELKQFNDFLHQLYKFCLQNDLRSFCDFLATKVFTLISKTKATDSDVTKEEARSFLVKKRAEARMRI
ncbi:ATP-dependent DNA helicase 2 subunit KU80-like isoform X1 [Eucalyptus grandis]|uniref:ATP-dependent DNA helicase 2 subunit KU80-like isoform X1 n=1 Tax=Eucalyptus grandis TaxID=71139 RepID=UPI00192EA928|nr:ATP-dependent DNA helicase 2 subunit KU80-like isoform X1 [Eucalyptus grandis]XP_039164327.1 ATP-dependent DNA helicase 2 subunit KU80-like isoform X1 [Eucalyptus grandis]XP_039164328.1 ATP-dependent DNA helicase 2 subunit KU80-like isoform X1 [Eucalyptus grandis]XP_039164329.1 ATP-dependent DNA helicase 2 subunit KU80-like isoform X1 [Eucalyptus grandis]